MATGTPAPPSRDIFRFFELPRELRDDIYDLCLEDRRMRLEFNIHLIATNVARSNLLLVSRAFNFEYCECSEKPATLKLRDATVFTWRSSRLPPAATHVQHLVMELVGASSDICPFVAHRQFIEETTRQIPKLESLAIRLQLPSTDRDPSSAKTVLPARNWLQLPKLATLRCYFFVGDVRDETIFDFGDNAELRLKWTKITGELEEVARGQH